jgi:hypothetical protein
MGVAAWDSASLSRLPDPAESLAKSGAKQPSAERARIDASPWARRLRSAQEWLEILVFQAFPVCCNGAARRRVTRFGSGGATFAPGDGGGKMTSKNLSQGDDGGPRKGGARIAPVGTGWLAPRSACSRTSLSDILVPSSFAGVLRAASAGVFACGG